MMRTFETPAGVRLFVQLPAGRVELEAVDTTQTTVELEPLKENDVTRRAIENATVEHRARADEHDVRVELGGEKFSLTFFGRSPDVLVRVRCPIGTTVEVKAAAADVKGIGRFGAVEVKNVSGDTAFPEIDGDARLKAVSGDVWAGRVSGSGQFETVSGDVRVERVAGECSLRSVSGDLSIADAGSSVKGKSVSGDQSLEGVAAGSVSLQSVSGDLRIAVRRGTSVWMDVNSRSGQVRSELDASEGEDRAAAVEIRASTVSGDVTITRAGAATQHTEIEPTTAA